MGDTKQVTLEDILRTDKDYIRVDECTDIIFRGLDDLYMPFTDDRLKNEWNQRYNGASFWNIDRFKNMEPFVYILENGHVYIHRDLEIINFAMNNTGDQLLRVYPSEDDIDESDWSEEELESVRESGWYVIMEMTFKNGRLNVLIYAEFYVPWEHTNHKTGEIYEHPSSVYDLLKNMDREDWLSYRSPRDRFSNDEADTIRKRWLPSYMERHKDIQESLGPNTGHYMPNRVISNITRFEGIEQRDETNARSRAQEAKAEEPKPKRRKTKLRF